MGKQTVVHSYNGILFHNKKLSSHEKTWRDLKCMSLSELSQSERLDTYDSKYVTSGEGKTV